MITFQVTDGYDRSKHPRKVTVRYMTLDEAKNLRAGEHVYVLDRYNHLRTAKVNGKPKTWVTRPGNVRVPLKYGLYEFFHAEFVNGVSDNTLLVIVGQ